MVKVDHMVKVDPMESSDLWDVACVRGSGMFSVEDENRVRWFFHASITRDLTVAYSIANDARKALAGDGYGY